MTTTRSTVPLLHPLLGVALVVIAAVIFILRYLGIGPNMPHDTATLVIACTLSGFGLVMAAFAL